MIYANYAATSPALSQAVVCELRRYVEGTHLNAGRNFEGLEAGHIALRARQALAKIFCVRDPLQVVFTSGATMSLNMAINGIAREGSHVIGTSIEHNAAVRPLELLRKNGFIELDWLPCNTDGSFDPQTLCKFIKPSTKLLVLSHASNVLGTILPAAECFKIAHDHGIITVLDAAQTAGVLPFDAAALQNCDVIAFAGHKGLCGLAGCGGLVLGDAAKKEMRPWLAGGTGSVSQLPEMPDFLPDRFEPGTQNTIGILSLAAAAEEILQIGIEKIRNREHSLSKRFLSGLQTLKNVRTLGTLNPDCSVAVVSVVVDDYDPADVSRLLFEKHGIVTRSGLHCAPQAHKTAGTFPAGTVRFSFGRQTTEQEIDAILEILVGF
ncbi:MAG: selenocysteine lyase SclA [Termitinemataceae bacterium]|nr:MAG: selenocysteine lyase SclA [Termitinemataceae bacterium]